MASAAASASLREAMVRLKAADDALRQAESLAALHPEAALSAANEAWRLDPQGWQKAQMLGALRQASGDLAGAESAYRAAASLAPDKPVAVEQLTRMLIDQGAVAKALTYAEQAALAAPTVAHLWANAGEAALAAGHTAWAVALGQIGLSVGTNLPAIHQKMARFHLANGNPVGEAFRALRAQRPKDVAIRRQAAEVVGVTAPR